MNGRPFNGGPGSGLSELVVPAVLDSEPAAGMTFQPVSPERVTGVRPLVLGYLRIGSNTTAEEADRMRREIAEFAEREGFSLLEVYMEMETSVTSAFAALVEALRRTEARTVVVPALYHFAYLPSVRLAMKELLERQTGAHVLVMHPGPEERS